MTAHLASCILQRSLASFSPVENSAKTPELRIPKSGKGKLRVGNPGNKGGTGRPKGPSLREFMAELRQNVDVHKALTRAAKDPESRGFTPVLRAMAEYDTEKPASKSDVTSAGKSISGVVILPSATDDE